MSGWGVPVVNGAVSVAGMLVNGAADLTRREKVDVAENSGGVCVRPQKVVFAQGSSPT